MTVLLRTLAWVSAAVLLLAASAARADTPVTLLESYAGHVNFVGTEATLQTAANSCTLATGAVSKALSGIPSGSTILKAYLYWAGSGSTPDYSVGLKFGSGTTNTVTATRQYTGSYTQNSIVYSYFSGVADVTSIVTGNGTVAFSGLSVDSTTNYCNVQGVLGAFALVVIYKNSSEPYRVLNLFEGFRFTHGDSFSLNLGNFRIPSPIGSNTGRIAHITWEGDPNLSGGGEQLTFNNVTMTDATNPSGNQFNSASNIDNDKSTWGVDFDAYTVSSPTINAGDTTATTTYGSGQDLVWLSAEIVAVPNVPVSDIKVALARTGIPTLNGSVTYTATVSSNGPDDETGSITFTNQLPPGMSYTTVTPGAGWNCGTPSGQAVTCTYAAGLTAGATLPTIVIKAKVGTMYSSFVESASVAGTLFDNVTDNNNATDVWTSTTGATWVFTDKRCTPGHAIGSAQSNCLPYNGPYTAGVSRPLYITYQNNGVATAYKNQDKIVVMRFSLTCYDPSTNAGIRATYGSMAGPWTLPLCTSNQMPATGTTAAWTTSQNIYLYANEASGILPDGPANFFYDDVGQIQLNLYDTTNNITAFTRFISVPYLVRFSSIVNSSSGTNDNANYFAEAGEAFTANVRVETADGSAAPNFGRESTPYSVVLAKPQSQTGALTYTPGTISSGTLPISVTYQDLGRLDLTASINSSGGVAGTYFGLPVTTSTATIGYFYPSYFTTTVTGGSTCLSHMYCPLGTLPAGEVTTIGKYVYSKQPFSASVSAFSRTGVDLTTHLSQLPAFTTTLTSYSQPGSTGVATAGTLALNCNTPPALPTPVNLTFGGTSPTAMPISVVYCTAVSWNYQAPHVAWDAPTSVYSRAQASFARRNSTTTTVNTTVSSNRGTAAVSVEGGIEVVNGRLLVDNANGSELIKMPLYLHAQYWTGKGWETTAGDTSTVTSSAAFSCQGTLSCPLSLQSGGTTLGSATSALWVNAPGAGHNGSALVLVNGGPAWLPTTQARIVFGTYKSRFVYIREVY